MIVVQILFGCILTFTVSETRQLIQGNLLWRHGDRSSRRTYPNDPYKGVWKEGVMQITEQGLAQEYNLGLFLRTKYGNLISDKYKEGEIFIKSTDVDRTIMSAQSVTAALYAPKNVTKWEGIRSFWRPFPVHVEPTRTDWLYNVEKYPEKGCKEYDNLMKKIRTVSPWYEETNKKYAKFFADLKKYTGTEKQYNAHGYSIKALQDNLFCLQSNHYKLPAWADGNVMRTLNYLAGVIQGLEFTDYEMKFTKLIAKMRSGVVLEHMFENMKNRINNKTMYSIVGYSAHDSTVVPFLMSLGAFNWIIPPYASCVMLDLYKEEDSTYSVEFWYRNDSSHEPYPLSFYDCGTKCSFEKFQGVAQTVMTDSTTAYLCGIKDEIYCCAYLFVGLAVFIASTALFTIIHWLLNKRKRKTDPYTMLRQDESDSIALNSSKL